MGDGRHSIRMSGLRLAVAAAGAAAAGLAAAGCASGTSSGTATASSGSTAGPLAGLSGKQVLARAVGNLKATSSFTVSGTVTQAATAITVDLGFRPGHGCKGTIAASGKGGLTMVVIGTTAWVKPSDAYWKSVAGKQAGQAIATLRRQVPEGADQQFHHRRAVAVLRPELVRRAAGAGQRRQGRGDHH